MFLSNDDESLRKKNEAFKEYLQISLPTQSFISIALFLLLVIYTHLYIELILDAELCVLRME
jgi:hypothetical protein